MKEHIQRWLGKAGYRIERLRPPLPGVSLFVLDYVLQILNQRRAGEVSFVQIGANDGMQEDPCYAWINRFPWRGVLVEPQPRLAARLRALHRDNSRIRVEQAIIADAPGAATLYYLRETDGTPEWASGIASMSRQAITQHRGEIPGFDALLAEAVLPAVTLAQLLAKYAIASLDYLQIDAEGADYRILQSIDFAQVKPAVIAYEHANLTPEENAACRALLALHGYHFGSWLGDTIACLPELFPVSTDRRRYVLE